MEDSRIMMQAGRLKDLQEELNEEISKIMDHMLACQSDLEILKERWSGSAADVFQKSFWLFYDGLWDEVKAMSDTVTYLVMVEESLEEAEREVRSLWEEKEVCFGGRW